jgi:tRNA pseudouridine38-40 synthase
MPRYFIELAYKGTSFSGFQVQHNANTVQAEVEKALAVFFRKPFSLTGSSRTDAGVHAMQNYFHFDFDGQIQEKDLYHLNALLPADIAVRRVRKVGSAAHCRYDALSRAYRYQIYRSKNPFLGGLAYFYPYVLNGGKLDEAARMLPRFTDFEAFSKRNSQVNHYQCHIMESSWIREGDIWVYRVKANRFLRGMVKGLVGTMLRVGRGVMELEAMERILKGEDGMRADFDVPGYGLYLTEVAYPDEIWGRD